MPSGVLIVDTQQLGQARCPYGPVTAADLVDGDVPVTCSQSSVFRSAIRLSPARQ
jgi:hypothetical protein